MKKHGFLSPNLPALTASIRKNGACQFAVAEAFNELGMSVLRDLVINPACQQEVLSASMFGRVLTSFQSAIILCERGLLSNARTLILAAAETAIILNAVAKDPSVCKALTPGMMHNERALALSWLSEPQVHAVLSKDDIETLKNRIEEIDKEYSTAKNLQDVPIQLDALANACESPTLANIVRRISAGNAAHASLEAIVHQTKNDCAVAAIQGFKFGPEEKHLLPTVSDAFSVMSHALTSIYRCFPAAKDQDDFEKCVAAWQSLSI